MSKGLIKVKNLTYGYEDDPVIKNVSLELRSGEVLLLEGENGAGKTTLLKCITNVLNSGKDVFYEEKEVYKNKRLIKNFSYVMSEDYLYDYMTMDENIKFFKKLFKEDAEYLDKVEVFVEKFGIKSYRNKLVKTLSQGTRNKLFIAIMFSKKHSVLILDEPFTALDKETQNVILPCVEDYKNSDDKAVLMVTHIEQFKRIATRKFILKREAQNGD